jgi:hypothetical protein
MDYDDDAPRAMVNSPREVAHPKLEQKRGAGICADGDGELPVVARLIVEIRSDGRRTLARGALEDLISGERTEIAARGDTPAALVASLWRSMTGIAALARRTARSLLPRR